MHCWPSPVDGHPGWFHLLSIVKSVAITMKVLVPLWFADLESLALYPRAVQEGHMVVLASVPEEPPSWFPHQLNEDTVPPEVSHSSSWPMSLPAFASSGIEPRTSLILVKCLSLCYIPHWFVFLRITILTRVRWGLKAAVTCIFLVAKGCWALFKSIGHLCFL